MMLFAFFLTHAFYSCEKESNKVVYENDMAVQIPYLWRTNIEFFDISAINDSMHFKDQIILPNEVNSLARFDINTGKISKKVNYFNSHGINVYDHHKYKNKAIIMDGWHNACLNMETMEFEWVKERHSQFERIWEWNSGIEDHFFLFAMPRGMGDTTNHRYRGC